MSWGSFLKWFCWSLCGSLVCLVIAIWIIDPFGNLPFSPPLKYQPIATNQRYSYPGIARDPAFNSAILGTSTVHLLRPDIFNEVMGARFANLSMSSARAYEQARLFEVFLRHHPNPNTLIIGLDIVWCTVEEKLTKYTFRRFPEWMYDDNPWNDVLHFFEVRTITTLIRKSGTFLGLRKSNFHNDGYYPFVPSANEYDLDKVRRSIYGTSKPAAVKTAVTPAPKVSFKSASWTYPSHALLENILNRLPKNTRKVLVFVPYHQHYQPDANSLSGAQVHECKKRVAAIAKAYPNSVVLDFMIPSPITKRDENYWDPLHYRVSVADRLAELIAQGAKGNAAPDGEYLVLEKNP
jgi:hypothetical protein